MTAKTTLNTYYKGKNIHDKPDCVEFNVPTKWLSEFTQAEYNTTLDEFLSEYTYDDSELIMNKAKEEKVFSYVN